MEYRELLTSFTESLGIKDASVDDEGVMRLKADSIELGFTEVSETGSLVMWSPLAEPPPEGADQLYALMMDAMFMGQGTRGATFSRNEGKIYLHRSESLAILDLSTFAVIVEGFLNTAEEWKKIIEGFRADESAGGFESKEEPRLGLTSGDYLQV